MAERSGLTLAAALWGVAFVALGMAALTIKAESRGVVGLTVVGHVLTLFALVLDKTEPAQPRSLAGRSTTILYLAGFLILELAGTVLLAVLGEHDLALWFALGASFSALGIAVSWQRVPSDHVLACQIFFHAAIVAPLVAALPVFVIDLTRNEVREEVSLGLTTMTWTVLVGCEVAVPLLIVTLITALAYDLSRPRSEPIVSWAVLMAHQLGFAALVFRWAGDGL